MSVKTQECLIDANSWRTGYFISAFIAIIAIFFVVPVFEKNFYTHLILQCCFTLLIFSSVYAIDSQCSILTISIIFLIPFMFFDLLSLQNHSLYCMILAYGCSLAFTMFSIIVLMKRILSAGLVNVDLIFGALMVYILSGILWSKFYFIENMLNPGSFDGAGILHFDSTTLLNAYEQQFNFLYYSFATLATLGMGDITPLTHLAKSLTAMEAMFGQLFVAIVIAKLVSVWWRVPEKI